MYKFVDKKTKAAVFIVDVLAGGLVFLILTLLMPWRLRKLNRIPDNPKNILVIRADYVGDVILALPALEALKKRHPLAKITFLTSVKPKALLEHNPFIDDIIEYDPPWFFRKKIGQAAREYARVFREIRKRKFQLALDLRGDLRNILFLTCFPLIPYRVSSSSSGGWYLLTKIAKYLPGQHEAEYHMEVVRAAGVQAAGMPLPRIFLTPRDMNYAADFLRLNGIRDGELLVAIHPGARKQLKQWPLERYAVVGKRLAEERHAKLLITGSPDERALADTLAAEIGKTAIVGAGEIPSLRGLAAILQRCSLYIGCSTGPTHLAAAVGTPTVVICGPESLERWHPLGTGNLLVTKEVPCRPCVGRENICFYPERNCLKLITPEDVFAAVSSRLDEAATAERLFGNRAAMLTEQSAVRGETLT